MFKAGGNWWKKGLLKESLAVIREISWNLAFLIGEGTIELSEFKGTLDFILHGNWATDGALWMANYSYYGTPFHRFSIRGLRRLT